MHSVQLVQRVESHDLDPRGVENFFARHNFEKTLWDADRARVAIVAWAFDQASISAEQSEVHTPSVDTDAVDTQFAFTAGDGEAVDDFVIETKAVPVESGGQLNGLVGEAVQFLKGEPAA